MVIAAIVLLIIALSSCSCAAPPIPPPRVEPPGTRISLTSATVYVPHGYDPALTSSTDIVVFIHGASWVMEQELYRSRRNAALACVSVPSMQYSERFGAQGGLSRFIDETTAALAREGISSAPLGRVCIASFSGGYAAVRAILATTGSRELVTDVVLADSLYPPRIGPDETLSEENLAPVLAFTKTAADAMTSQPARTFVLSQLYPPEEQYRGNTTTRAAAWLIERTGAIRDNDGISTTSRGQRILYSAKKGAFLVWGVAGMTTQDHFEHFYGIGDLLNHTGLARMP